MAGNFQMIVLVPFLLSITSIARSTTVTSKSIETPVENPSDLDAAEANGKLEIIKQIKKVNDDGSYTIGYEADDGTFKIESRDVLGNIKGTYGYIDDRGEIKRVSYSTSNTTEIVTSTAEPSSVVQRIPAKLNRTSSPTTRRPYGTSTLSSTSSTSSGIQLIPRRRLVSSTLAPSTTSEKHNQFIKEALVASKSTTAKPTTILYETSTPARILAQSKPLVRSTVSTQNPTSKSEGQLLRPEVTLKPTDMPLYRRLPIKTTLLDDVKPVTEEPETRGNLLRRQLPQEKGQFDPRQHVINVEQASGDDTVDVYSASVTTGAPRPLFTTLRPRAIQTTAVPVINRPTPFIRYSPAYQKPSTRPTTTTELRQESATETSVTASPVPVVQIPPNNEEPQRQQYVELRHPFHRGAILVPVNQLQGRRVPQNYQNEHNIQNVPNLQHLQNPNHQQIQQAQHYQQIQQQQQQDEQEYQQVIIQNDQRGEPIYLRRVPKFRPIPVHVDENGYVHEYQQPVSSTPYPQQAHPHRHRQRNPQYISQADIIHEVDQIKPPVSTKDFQKLLEQLILRQSRLEKISSLTRNNPDLYRQRPVYQDPYHQNPVQFVPRTQTAQPQQQHPVIVRPEDDDYNRYGPVTYTPPSTNYPTKRMARLQQNEEEYLPAPVREMLLLRMLQLAINPSLPLDVSDNLESATTPSSRKEAVRNVEILGEDDDHKRPIRTKRYKEIELDYFD